MNSEVLTTTPIQLISLVDLKPGDRAIIKQIKGDTGKEIYLMELGLLPGTSIKYIKQAPLGDPIEICLRNYHLSIRSDDAGVVLVEKQK